VFWHRRYLRRFVRCAVTRGSADGLRLRTAERTDVFHSVIVSQCCWVILCFCIKVSVRVYGFLSPCAYTHSTLTVHSQYPHSTLTVPSLSDNSVYYFSVFSSVSSWPYCALNVRDTVDTATGNGWRLYGRLVTGTWLSIWGQYGRDVWTIHAQLTGVKDYLWQPKLQVAGV
jgi:hypothetical protein